MASVWVEGIIIKGKSEGKKREKGEKKERKRKEERQEGNELFACIH
jgi:hypothetical protein